MVEHQGEKPTADKKAHLLYLLLDYADVFAALDTDFGHTEISALDLPMSVMASRSSTRISENVTPADAKQEYHTTS